QAYYDQLTGLPNRALFMELLKEAEELEAKGDEYAVLFIDVDNLKPVNDSLGHEAGDTLLKAVTQRMLESVRGEDTVARLSGDEFAVLLCGTGSAEHAEIVAERVLASLKTPVTIGDHLVRAGVSIGLATSEACHAIDISPLRAADMAMYVAKSGGKGRCEVFEPSLHAAQVQREQLRADLHEALDAGQFELFYQPIVDLPTQRVSGFEALLRWRHPERGVLVPAEFLAEADACGVMVPVGRWALAEACRQVRAWEALHPQAAPASVAVNLSARQLRHPGIVADVEDALTAAGLPGSRLQLEITEGAVMENGPGAVETLRRLKVLGVRLSVDDFGVGYSSLSYLHRFPVDVLKVDRSFVTGLGSVAACGDIVRAIVGMAHGLGLDVVAEGVETAEHLVQVRALDCDFAQGYFFSHPVSGDEAGTLLGAAPAW
ncbi:MAG: putative bifunctional diguanylate cyclase/phosphodiesterase, partial [Longimicrobiaceae bacterium]